MKLTTKLLKEMIQQELSEMEKADETDETEHYKKDGKEITKISKKEFDRLAKGKKTYAGNPSPVGIKSNAEYVKMVKV
jgi:hypothetical protein